MATPGAPLYDTLGKSYAEARIEDPRVAAQIHAALDGAARIVNVGAGTGSYEPRDRVVLAVDPSPTMIRQRRPGSAPSVLAAAEALPIHDDSFDAAMAVLTVHHWSDLPRGLAELRRVAARQVVVFFEPLALQGYWLLDYFPDIADLPTERRAPGTKELERELDVVDVRTVMVPADCTDGFGAAYWSRPEAYLDPTVQAGISSLALLTVEARQRGTEQLRADLGSGRWEDRHGHLRHLDEFDGGYRLAIAHR